MARRRAHPPLTIFLNSRLLGWLNRQPSGAIDFRYDGSWLAWEHALPVSLSLPLREDRYVGRPVVAVFDNLLPDSMPIRTRMAERIHAEGTDAYSLLLAAGRDCVGALQFLPEGERPGPAGEIAGTPVSDDEIARILGDLGHAPLGLSEDNDFRISIAGAQEKTALLFWKKQWQRPRGTTATTHILKPQIGRLPNGLDLTNSVENEFVCLKLVSALGLPAAKAEIGSFGGRHVLVIERFDRLWTKDKRLLRLPQEDCCQALSVSPTAKYESEGGPGIAAVLDLLRGSDEPEQDRINFLKSQIAFWLLAATDGHAKNFSVFLSPGGRFRMTPLYDVISAQPSADAGQIRQNQVKLAMAIGKSRHYRVNTVLPRHFVETAALSGMGAPTVESVFADLRARAPGALAHVLESLPPDFPTNIVNSIANGVRERLSLL